MQNTEKIKNINIFFVSPNTSIENIYKKFNKIGKRCLLVMNRKKHLIGTISEGDVRKAILKGATLKEKILKIYNKNPFTVIQDEYQIAQIEKKFSKDNLDLIPVVQQDQVVDILFWDMFISTEVKIKKISTPVVIMAGGKGSRLDPFTKVLPKPLIPIQNSTIIERVINSFVRYGINNFYFTLNYKSKLIKAYFEELNVKQKINFIIENHPLGTAGALSKLKNQKYNNFIVTNCDTLVDIDIPALLKFHNDGKFDISLIILSKKYTVPYGVCKIDTKGHLESITEKPEMDLLVNTGVYVLNKKIINLIPNNKYLDMPDLIKKTLKSNKKIGIFPIDEKSWIDIGQWSEYKNALNILS